MKIEGRTDVGRKRPHNEDGYSSRIIAEGLGYAVVCDGMGGVAGGALASKMATVAVSNALDEQDLSKLTYSKIKQLLVSAVKQANRVIYERSKVDKALTGMGTTVVAAVVCGHVLHLCHVGDSRAYLFANGILTQLTKDHSIVQSMVDRGEITREEARTHPNRNILEKAVGVNADVTCDYSCLALRAEDQLLLCTDGLTNFVSDADISEIMQRFSPEKTPVELVNAANNNGGGDNITAVIVKVEE